MGSAAQRVPALVNRSPLPYHQLTPHCPLSYEQTIDSRSSYGLLVLKLVLQLPTNHQ